MNALGKIAFANMLLMGLLPEKTLKQIVKEEEERANRAIAEGRLNPYEVRKQVDKALKPLIQSELIKCRPVVYYKDEKGQLKRKKEWPEELK